ncbi:MAG: GNAT family N-acetyltransferase [Phycisphaerales bacterium]
MSAHSQSSLIDFLAFRNGSTAGHIESTLSATLHHYPNSCKWFSNVVDETRARRRFILLAINSSCDMAGIVILTPKHRRAQTKLSTIFVREQCRCQGVGRALSIASIKLARAHRHNNIYVTVRAEDQSTLTFFNSVGFTQTEFCASRYGARRHEIVLTRDLVYGVGTSNG